MCHFFNNDKVESQNILKDRKNCDKVGLAIFEKFDVKIDDHKNKHFQINYDRTIGNA